MLWPGEILMEGWGDLKILQVQLYTWQVERPVTSTGVVSRLMEEQYWQEEDCSASVFQVYASHLLLVVSILFREKPYHICKLIFLLPILR